jgi:hypothetical protein
VLKSAPNRQAIFGPEAKKQYLCIVKTKEKNSALVKEKIFPSSTAKNEPSRKNGMRLLSQAH